MMIALITFKSSLVPLLEGLWSSNSWEFELSGFRRNRTDDLGIDSPSLWPTEPRLHVRSRWEWRSIRSGASGLPCYYFPIYIFSYLGLFFEMTHEPSSLEEGMLVEDDWDLPCPWQKGGGETSAIGREALRRVDYVDSSMGYVPLWILESSALS